MSPRNWLHSLRNRLTPRTARRSKGAAQQSRPSATRSRSLAVEPLEDRSVPASFTGLGDLPGGSFSSGAWGVSADGSVVVGDSIGASGFEAFRWEAGTGMVGLGDLPGGGSNSRALGVSADGSVVVGRGFSASGTEAFRWEAGTGMVGLGKLPGAASTSAAWGVSADGSVVVGDSSSASGTEAFRWQAGTGMAGLGDLPGGGSFSRALGVSADGSVVVGQSLGASGSEPFRWEAGTGMAGLGDLPGGFSGGDATGVSADGSVVVGGSHSVSGFQAFRWEAGTGMIGLGDLPGGAFLSAALGVSADGSVVVGRSVSASGQEAFIWDSARGMRSLRDVLVSDYGLGAALQGWRLDQATAVSADGTAFVGLGINPSGQLEAWVLDWADGITEVTATYDEPNNGDDLFGTYISGVKLTNEFEITVEGATTEKLRIDLPGTAFDATIDRAESGPTRFAFDPGMLAAGTHNFTITALDADENPVEGEFEEFKGKIKVIDTLPFALQVEVPGTGLVNASDLRLVAGVASETRLTFRTTTDLPLPIYSNRLAVTFVNRANDGRSQHVLSFQGDVATFPKPLGDFGNTVPGIEQGDFDYDAYLTPAAAYSYNSDSLHQLGESGSARVFVITRPEWLAGVSGSFGSDGAYHFDEVTLAPISISLPALSTGVEWIDEKLAGTTSGASVSATLNVIAPLVLGDTPIAAGHKLSAFASILGKTVFDKTYSGPSELRWGGTLASRTLIPSGVFVELSGPVSTGEVTLWDTHFTIPVPTVAKPLLSITLELDLKLLGSLTVNKAGLMVSWDEQQGLIYVPSGTLFQLTATAKAQATGTLKVEFLGGWFMIEGEVFGTAEFNLTGEAHFGNSVLDPTVTSASIVGTLQGTYGYSLTASMGKKDEQIEKKEEDFEDTFLFFPEGPKTLFELSIP